jgi:hypothetical protein
MKMNVKFLKHRFHFKIFTSSVSTSKTTYSIPVIKIKWVWPFRQILLVILRMIQNTKVHSMGKIQSY